MVELNISRVLREIVLGNLTADQGAAQIVAYVRSRQPAPNLADELTDPQILATMRAHVPVACDIDPGRIVAGVRAVLALTPQQLKETL